MESLQFWKIHICVLLQEKSTNKKKSETTGAENGNWKIEMKINMNDFISKYSSGYSSVFLLYATLGIIYKLFVSKI